MITSLVPVSIKHIIVLMLIIEARVTYECEDSWFMNN